MKAVWNDVILAESDKTITFEGKEYFPKKSLNKKYFNKSAKTSYSPHKGNAVFYDLEVDGKKLEGGAWYYPDPRRKVDKIKKYVTFDPEVSIEESDPEES